MIPEKTGERINMRRIVRATGPRVRSLPYRNVMRAIGIPEEEARRGQVTNCTIVAGPMSAFVEYPGCWSDYIVQVSLEDPDGRNSVRYQNLVNFVFENVNHDATYTDGRIPTVYLDHTDFGRIKPEKLAGVKAIKKTFLDVLV